VTADPWLLIVQCASIAVLLLIVLFVLLIVHGGLLLYSSLNESFKMRLGSAALCGLKPFLSTTAHFSIGPITQPATGVPEGITLRGTSGCCRYTFDLLKLCT
jgi:hypothetical protein